MTVTNYAQWEADGAPWRAANPCLAIASACTAHGVGYGIIGDVATHLNVLFPEDHAPYSHTPWPGSQPYPFVLATDLYTTETQVAHNIIAAKLSGRLPCLKYINWTDEHGDCWHTSWQPTEVTVTSTDRGHIHCSIRTDHTVCNHATGFDPFVGVDMALTQEEHDRLVNIDAQVNALIRNSGPALLTSGSQANELAKALAVATGPAPLTLSADDRAAIVAALVSAVPTAETIAVAVLDEQHRRDAA